MEYKVDDTIYYTGTYFYTFNDTPLKIINITNTCYIKAYANINVMAPDGSRLTTSLPFIISKAEYFKRELDKMLRYSK